MGKDAYEKGGQINKWSDENLATIDKLYKPLWDEFIADWESRGAGHETMGLMRLINIIK